MDISRTLDRAFGKSDFRALELDAGLRPVMKDRRLLVVPGTLELLAREAFRDAAFYLRREQLRLMAAALEAPDSSENDRFVIRRLLRNALVAAEGALPLCQDTGTATAVAWKSESVATGGDDEESISAGAAEAYRRYFLRSSQVAPRSMFDEFDTGSNLPAQVDIYSVPDGPEGPRYRFLFVAKGGGSSNKTAFFQMSKALLEPAALEAFIREKVRALGVAACPPYRLAMVIGGTSPEANLKALKLATTELLDGLPGAPGVSGTAPGGAPGALTTVEAGDAYRDAEWERILMAAAAESGLGAQFGGQRLALDARVLRLSRHAGSCPVSIGVSCSAHRNVLAEISAEGARIERLEGDPVSFLRDLGGEAAGLADEWTTSRAAAGRIRAVPGKAAPAETGRRGEPRSRSAASDAPAVKSDRASAVSLDAPMEDILARLRSLGAGDKVLLSGPLLVARDAAHLAWHRLIQEGKELPGYLRNHPIYYAGPSATPPGKVIGSFGPTTAQRMDGYAEELMSRGVALVTLAKGNRGKAWAESCGRWGAVYLGTIGGAAAAVADENIRSSELLDYPELGMEAVRRIVVEDLVAFVVIDAAGRDLYAR